MGSEIFSGFDLNDRKAAVAIHEAAHAVVGSLFGIRCLGVGIEGAIYSRTRCNGYTLIERVAASDFEVAVHFAAGPVAEEMLTGRLRLPLAEGSDMDQIDWFCRGEDDVLQMVLDEARRLVRAHAGKIRRVANALLDRTRLDRAALEAAGVIFVDQNGNWSGRPAPPPNRAERRLSGIHR